MKKIIFPILVTFLIAAAFLFFDSFGLSAQRLPKKPSTKREIPEVIVLAKGTKPGKVTFNHQRHNAGEYTAGGPILCIECHHTAQAAATLIDVPPHKTVWPAGRTTTLTAELFAEDPKNAGVAACRDCHARSGTKPRLIDSIPTIEDPETGIVATLTNQTAFHQACDTCHYQIGFRSAGSKSPKATNCASCHKTPVKKPRRF